MIEVYKLIIRGVKNSKVGKWFSKGTKGAWNRTINNSKDLDADLFKGLKNNGVVDVNRSGTNRPKISTPNSYYETNGGHVLIYDDKGKLIYDINSKRVKGFKINTNPSGEEFFGEFKLEGSVPDFIKNMFGW